ncbi:SHOCT domain-containing protein [Natronincola ferrireducens]|uniref:Short C-terminal domain-containing protein n=1 Tax=Natronincola ferrireducens TaxID=393762 RepID=A0A1G9IE40_9FIRM|nr:SHOCT domain-containing protein [Natronincola ferrireducens]SDL23392.1 Short C-terminal domain-containing protein [Natronincola ferrireducens]
MGCLGVFLTILSGLILMVLFVEYTGLMIGILFAIITLGIILYNKASTKQKEVEIKLEEEKAKKKVWEDGNKRKYNIPQDAKLVRYYKGNPNINKGYIKFYTWKDEKNINFVDSEFNIDIGKVQMQLDDIKYYYIIGDIYNEMSIEGGGNGGSSLGGAVVGGLVAGGAGAVIGSRKKNDPIKTINKKVDERKTIVVIKENNKVFNMEFEGKTYDVLLELLPEKERDYVKIISTKENNEDWLYKQIEKLASLKNEGILTEEEFQGKKKALLEKI